VDVARAHDELVKREFAKQAATFEDPSYSFGDERLMAWILSNVEVAAGASVLDVAAGTGHVARGFAPRVRQVVALDLTPEMLELGKSRAEAEGLRNILFERGDASSVPHLDDSFDLVVCRFAVHHFERPRLQVGEMVRVCRPGGRVALIDLVVADGQPGEPLNELERLRDPSHQTALSLDGLSGLVEEAGARVVHQVHHDQRLDPERWLAQAEPPAEIARLIRNRLHEELAGGPPTGMRPFLKEGSLRILQRWAIVVGEAG
jgi:SAM-dependent methyltransferase